MEAVIVALIGLVGVVLAAKIEKSRKQDAEEHGILMKTVERIEDKIDNHIDWHLDNKKK